MVVQFLGTPGSCEPGPSRNTVRRWSLARSRALPRSCSLFSVPMALARPQETQERSSATMGPGRQNPPPICRPRFQAWMGSVGSVSSHISARQHRQSPIAPRMFGERWHHRLRRANLPFSRPRMCPPPSAPVVESWWAVRSFAIPRPSIVLFRADARLRAISPLLSRLSARLPQSYFARATWDCFCQARMTRLAANNRVREKPINVTDLVHRQEDRWKSWLAG